MNTQLFNSTNLNSATSAAPTNDPVSIGEAARQAGLTEDTIRFYEKTGLLPAATRKANGHRTYNRNSIRQMKMIQCLKKTGMSLEEMKPYIQLGGIHGSLDDAPELHDHLLQHREQIQQQVDSLLSILDFIDSKILAGSMEHPHAQQESYGLNVDDVDDCTLPVLPSRLDSLQARMAAFQSR
ncbi:MerR family transcriptional regulator [Paenibacillus sp. WLX1005]|uniref:MerR family transcriptional regulator n=1 Tax=Paenibacillus sp. WLX1005 TaxID=3243766 RepID=UPI003983F037